VSYAALARRVRDGSRPLAVRRAALLACVQLYRPLGFEGTLRHLTHACGPLTTPERLVRAADMLDASRRAWLAEIAAYAGRRSMEKAAGRRNPPVTQLRSFAAMTWPGGTGDVPVSPRFLRQFGVAPREGPNPPVRLRRRLRWHDRALAEPPTTSRFDPSYPFLLVLFVPAALCCCCGGFALVGKAWTGLIWAGAVTGVVLLLMVVAGFIDNPRRADRLRREELVVERARLLERLSRLESVAAGVVAGRDAVDDTGRARG
jgi:hypothetical protein